MRLFEPFLKGRSRNGFWLLVLSGSLLCPSPSHAVVLFRLPLATDTTTHYYVDHDSTTGLEDWKCGTQTYNGHRGTDFSGGPRGKTIYAGAEGTVGYKIDGFGDGFLGSTDGGGGGNHVRLNHAENFTTFYFHMTMGSVTSKAVGANIACGEAIGGVGTSGNSTGFHLHFEPRISGSSDDPYAGACGGPITYWYNQNNGSPLTNCYTILQAPFAPSSLTANAISSNQIALSWTDNATDETSVKIERTASLGGTWMQIGTVSANVVSYTSSGLVPSSTYFYRVRAANAHGNSGYSGTAYSTTSNSAPMLTAIPTQVVNSGAVLNLAASATDFGLGTATVIADFENFSDGAASVMFRPPNHSSTTSAFIEATPNVTAVIPTNISGSTKALHSNFSFKTGTANPWLRLTTDSTTGHPNPTVHFKQQLRFNICADKSVKLGLGLRETGTSAAIGADGGKSGTIEFVGVPSKNGTSPNPSRIIPAGIWTNVTFDFPVEAASSFTGDGVLGSANNKGVLECLAIAPNGGTGDYNIYVDNFVSVLVNAITYSLDASAPAGATINSTNGAFTWSAPLVSALVTNTVTIRATDNGAPALSDTKTFNIVVVPPPRLSSMTVTNGQASLVWQTFTGKNYQVQFKNALTDPVWNDLGGAITASGNTLSTTNSATANAQRFYRIVQLN